MIESVILICAGVALLVAVGLWVWGASVCIHGRWSWRRLTLARPGVEFRPNVELVGFGRFLAEPGVLINTLWEHLPNAQCHAGECGGCLLRRIDGSVRWIRDPQFKLNRQTHLLACSCIPMSDLRCVVDQGSER